MLKFVCILFLMYSEILYAFELNIVVSPSCHMTNLSRKEVQQLFLHKKKFFKNQLIITLDRKEKDIYQYFVEHYLHKSLRQIKAYWLRMLFTGKQIPPSKITFDEIKVQQHYSNICYITYIFQDTIVKNWKVISVQ